MDDYDPAADPRNAPPYRAGKTPTRRRHRRFVDGKPRGSAATRATIPGVRQTAIAFRDGFYDELRRLGIDVYDSRRGQL